MIAMIIKNQLFPRISCNKSLQIKSFNFQYIFQTLDFRIAISYFLNLIPEVRTCVWILVISSA